MFTYRAGFIISVIIQFFDYSDDNNDRATFDYNLGEIGYGKNYYTGKVYKIDYKNNDWKKIENEGKWKNYLLTTIFILLSRWGIILYIWFTISDKKIYNLREKFLPESWKELVWPLFNKALYRSEIIEILEKEREYDLLGLGELPLDEIKNDEDGKAYESFKMGFDNDKKIEEYLKRDHKRKKVKRYEKTE